MTRRARPGPRPRTKAVPWDPFTFASVGLAAASGRLPVEVFMAYIHAPTRRRKAARTARGRRK